MKKFAMFLALVPMTHLFALGQFEEMFCESVLRPPVVVTTSPSTLTLEADGSGYSIPVKFCQFSGTQRGLFSCRQSYGEGQTLVIETKIFRKFKKNMLHFVVTSDAGNYQSEDFYIDYTNSEGFKQPSECQVDEAYVYVKK